MRKNLKKTLALLLALCVMLNAASSVFASGAEEMTPAQVAKMIGERSKITLGTDNIIAVTFGYNDGKESATDTVDVQAKNLGLENATDFSISESCEEKQPIEGFAVIDFELAGTSDGLLTVSVTRTAAAEAPDAVYIWHKNKCMGEAEVEAVIEENPTPKYTVNYMLQGLDGEYVLSSSDVMTGKKDTMVAVTELTKEHNGFRFVSSESNVESMIPPADDSMVINLFYDREKYTITFDTNGKGEAPAALENVMYQATVTAPEAPEAEGFEFMGWYTEKSCENLWDFEKQQVTGNMTLYASWKELEQQPDKTEVQRIEGADRIETAIATSKAGWEKAEVVVLANALRYPDALAGATIAHANDAPILLTAGNSLEKEVKAEMERLGAKKVYLLGGEAVMSAALEQEIKALKLESIRLAGTDRYGTAAAIAKQLAADSSTQSDAVFIASGEDYPDALSAAPVAAISGSPVLFIAPNGPVDKETAAILNGSNVKNIFVIGGEKAISAEAMESLRRDGIKVERYSGADRYETAARIAEAFAESYTGKGIAIATGRDFPDALAGSVYAAKMGYPMLLTAMEHTSALDSYVEKHQPQNAVVFGGNAAVPQEALGVLGNTDAE
ncbi:MAG: hypothetical protein E7559_01995 [Ruminococcaceae bacterium]|nr:hypothetical protein [Oscillospiraceae bacterium]